MADVEVDVLQSRDLQRLHHEPLDLDVALDARVPVDLRADLERLARAIRAIGQRMHDAAGVAEPCHARPVEQVRVDTRDLRRDVSAQAQRAARELVHELEGLEIEVVSRTGEQRLHVLEQRRHHELVAVHREEIEERTAQPLNARGLRGQDVLDVLRQEPGAHGLGGSDERKGG